MAKNLECRVFAETGKNVSILGLGTVKFGRNQGVKYPSGGGFVLPTDSEISCIIDLCIEQGINLLDTAPAYGVSEERLGKIMGFRRKDFFLVTKTGEEFINSKSRYIFSAEHTRMSVERSLKRLKTDYLDCVLVHSNRDDLQVINNTPVVEVLNKMKETGKILSIGVSSYSLEGGKTAVDLCDAVMVAYNINDLSQREVIDYAHSKGKAVLIKKGFASGHMKNIEENIKFILNTRGVTSLIFGSITPANIISNVGAV